MDFKKKKIKVIALILFCVLLLITIIVLSIYNKGDIIFSKTFYYDLGSITLKIYENGNVYEDREIEEPNHKPKYKKIKELNKSEILKLKQYLEEAKNDNDLKKYINKLIYGDENYNLTQG